MAKAGIRNAKREDLIPGAVIRMMYTGDDGMPEAHVAAWSDCIIAHVDGDVITLLRPRCTFDAERAVVRHEQFNAPAPRIVDKPNWQLVLDNYGRPVNYAR